MTRVAILAALRLTAADVWCDVSVPATDDHKGRKCTNCETPPKIGTPCCDYTKQVPNDEGQFHMRATILPKQTNKFGNALSTYYHYRALASLRYEPFRLANHTADTCTGSASWFSCLPRSVEAPDQPAVMTEEMQDQATRASCCMFGGVAPHMCVGSWTSLLPTIRTETRAAMDKFSKQTNTQAMEVLPTDAVLHFRCGDIMTFGHEQYGLLPFEWYAINIPAGIRRVLIVGNFRAKQSGQGNQDAAGDNTCEKILPEFLRYISDYSTRHKRNWDVKEVSRGFNEDFLLLTKATTMLSSVSTYSFWAAVINSVPDANLILPVCDLFFQSGTPPLPLKNEVEDFRDTLTKYYRTHNPDKLPVTDKVAKSFYKRQEKMSAKLSERYGAALPSSSRIKWVQFPPPLPAHITTKMTVEQLLGSLATHTSPHCLNVDQGPTQGDDYTCFSGDDVGMVCAGDGTPDEAYCTRDTAGVLVCARAKGGGKCVEGELPPPTLLSAFQRAKKAKMQQQLDEERASYPEVAELDDEQPDVDVDDETMDDQATSRTEL